MIKKIVVFVGVGAEWGQELNSEEASPFKEQQKSKDLMSGRN